MPRRTVPETHCGAGVSPAQFGAGETPAPQATQLGGVPSRGAAAGRHVRDLRPCSPDASPRESMPPTAWGLSQFSRREGYCHASALDRRENGTVPLTWRTAVFLALVLCLASGATYSATGADAANAAKIEHGYIRAQKPSVHIPPYLGDRYEDSVPDTLELAEMARLAINGLTGPLDPAAGHELYFEVNWCRNPPVMIHDFSDWCVIKFLGPMVLMRIICGSDHNLDVQQATIETYLRSVGPDGLFHIPKASRDWQFVHLWDEVKPQSALPAEDYGGGGIFSVYSRWIEAAWLYHARDPQGPWGALARQMAGNAMNGITDKGDFAYCGGGDKVPTGFLGADGWIIQALAQHYRVTGDQARRT